MYLLGLDIGSSSVKASLINADTGALVAAAGSPKTEMSMKALKPGWAEQSPEEWWKHVKICIAELLTGKGINAQDIKAIGISYQMHGLVAVDKNGTPLRDSIIWCDSRAVPYGEKAFNDLGHDTCLRTLLNSPGNFTASKLKWVKENEPELYAKIDKIMLPGDYIAYKLSGVINTTSTGLSEGILWDYEKQAPSERLMTYYGFAPSLIPELVPVFGKQSAVSSSAASETGLATGTVIAYRAGDQPNNAFSLNVLNPGEVAATAGTSGVVYGVTEESRFDEKSRVNTFVHVNHIPAQAPRYGVLLCVNGTGIANSWLRRTLALDEAANLDYGKLNDLASGSPIGAKGLKIYPFGNGAERTLQNNDINASITGLNFNTHNVQDLVRAGQEGIVHALNYGFEIMKNLGVRPDVVRAGEANMFLSPIFREAFANVTGTVVELYNTDGAQGAARGAGVGAGVYASFKEAFEGLKTLHVTEPQPELSRQYAEAYNEWKEGLLKMIQN